MCLPLGLGSKIGSQDIYQIAKNCRTSVEMIEKFCAVHIKNALDAAAINVVRPKPTRRKTRPARQADDADAHDQL